MHDETESSTTWLKDAEGTRIGLRVVKTAEGPLVQLVVPSRDLVKEITADQAAQLVEILEQGMTFAAITGAPSFRLDLEEF